MNSCKITRIASLVLALMLLVSMSACSKTPASSTVSTGTSSAEASSTPEEKLYYNKTGLPICDETITVTLTGPNGAGVDWNKYVVRDLIQKELGINLDCTTYTSDAWETQLTLMMTTDKLPDILAETSITRADCNSYGKDGYLLDISKYLDLMPNYVERMEKDSELAAFSRDENGAIYGISKTRDSLASRAVAMAWLNNKWLKAVNMDAPKTTDELYNVLKAFKEKDANENGDPNDEIPLSFTYDKNSGMRTDFVIRSAFGIYGYDANYQLQVDANGKVQLMDTTENWKAYVTYMHKLYDEKLLDNNCFIMTSDEFNSKIKSNLTGLFGNWTVLGSVLGTKTAEIYSGYNFFTGVTDSAWTKEVIYPLWNNVTATCVNEISAKTKYPEAICRLFDYFYTDEGLEMIMYGKEGVSFDKITDKYGVNSYINTKYAEAAGVTTGYRNACVAWPNAFAFLTYSPALRVVDNSTDAQLQDFVKNADPVESSDLVYNSYKELGRRSVKCTPVFPNLVYTADEAAERNACLTALVSYIQTTKAAYISGTQDIDSTWDSYLSTLETMGLSKLLKIEQAAYDRYAKNLK